MSDKVPHETILAYGNVRLAHASVQTDNDILLLTYLQNFVLIPASSAMYASPRSAHYEIFGQYNLLTPATPKHQLQCQYCRPASIYLDLSDHALFYGNHV